MQTATNRWLDRLAKAYGDSEGPASDYRLAKLLEIHQAIISKYRTKGVQMEDDRAYRVAELLKLHPMVVIAEIHAERSRDHRAQRLWDQVARKYARKGGTAAAVILAAQIFGGPSISPSQIGSQGSGERGGSVYYVKQRRRQRTPHYKPGRIVTLEQCAA